jgi:hypothetical protein
MFRASCIGYVISHASTRTPLFEVLVSALMREDPAHVCWSSCVMRRAPNLLQPVHFLSKIMV